MLRFLRAWCRRQWHVWTRGFLHCQTMTEYDHGTIVRLSCTCGRLFYLRGKA